MFIFISANGFNFVAVQAFTAVTEEFCLLGRGGLCVLLEPTFSGNVSPPSSEWKERGS
jgi:hypothetical protein